MKWRLRLEVGLWRHGLLWGGVITISLASAVTWLLVVPEAGRRHEAALEELRVLQASEKTRIPDPAERALQQDVELIDEINRVVLAESEVNAVLRQLVRVSNEKGLPWTEAGFQATGEGLGGLRRLQLTLEVRAGYPQLRSFVEAVLLDFPAVSVDQLSMKRESSASQQGEMRLRLSIWTNPVKSRHGKV